MAETLYEKLKQMGLQIDHHGSDLYVPFTDVSYQLVQQAAKEHKQDLFTSFALFTSEGQTWIEVPFAYDPYWQEKGVQ